MPSIILMNLAAPRRILPRFHSGTTADSTYLSKVIVNSTTFRLLSLRPRAVRKGFAVALASTPEHRDGKGGLL
jgi:hypothetical protein